MRARKFPTKTRNRRSIERIAPAQLDSTTTPILDVRNKCGRTQIRGALRYDAKALLAQDPLALPLPHETRIVIYGDDDESASRVAARMREEGYRDVALLDGGFEAYESAGLPVEELTQEQPVPGSERGVPRI